MSAAYTPPHRAVAGQRDYPYYGDCLDVLAIWGLLWHGGRRRAVCEAQARAQSATAP